MCPCQTRTCLWLISEKKGYIYLFLKDQFTYLSLLWIFSTGAVKYNLNRLPERGSIASPNGEPSTFNDMLSKSNDTNIHIKGIKKLMIEFYKYFYDILAPIMKEIFLKKKYLSIVFRVVE